MAEENKTDKNFGESDNSKVTSSEIARAIDDKLKDKKVTENKEEKAWKEFIIPLRRKFKKTARYRRVPKAIRAIKEFLVRHMKSYDRDLNKIKLDKYLNEFVWARGIRNPPARIKVRAVIDGDFIRAELAELTERLKFKKTKLEKRESTAKANQPKKKEAKPEETHPSEAGTRPSEVELEEEKAEEKEKKAAVVEAGQKMEKAEAKKMKHEVKVSKQPKHQRRMALQK